MTDVMIEPVSANTPANAEYERLKRLTPEARREEVMSRRRSRVIEEIILFAAGIRAMHDSGDDLSELDQDYLRLHLAIARGELLPELVPSILDRRRLAAMLKVSRTSREYQEAYLKRGETIEVYERAADGSPAKRLVPATAITPAQLSRAFQEIGGGMLQPATEAVQLNLLAEQQQRAAAQVKRVPLAWEYRPERRGLLVAGEHFITDRELDQIYALRELARKQKRERRQ